MTVWTNELVAGYLPTFIHESDPRPAQQQLHANYVFGGFRPFAGFTLTQDAEGQYALNYPNDPLMKELSRTQLRDETIVLFTYSWVAVIQSLTEFTVARMD